MGLFIWSFSCLTFYNLPLTPSQKIQVIIKLLLGLGSLQIHYTNTPTWKMSQFFLFLGLLHCIKKKVFATFFQRTGKWDVFIKVSIWHSCARRHSGHRRCGGTDGSTGVEMPPHQVQSSSSSKHTLLRVHLHAHLHKGCIKQKKMQSVSFYAHFSLKHFGCQLRCSVNNQIWVGAWVGIALTQ